MDKVVLVTEEIEAGRRFAQAFNQYAPVKAAFWLKDGEASERSFYLASNQINSSNERLAYREILRVNSTMRSLYLKPMQIVVLSGASSLAQAAEELNMQFPDPLGHMLGAGPFGGTYIDYAYVYPPIVAPADGSTAPGSATASR